MSSKINLTKAMNSISEKKKRNTIERTPAEDRIDQAERPPSSEVVPPPEVLVPKEETPPKEVASLPIGSPNAPEVKAPMTEQPVDPIPVKRGRGRPRKDVLTDLRTKQNFPIIDTKLLIPEIEKKRDEIIDRHKKMKELLETPDIEPELNQLKENKKKLKDKIQKVLNPESDEEEFDRKITLLEERKNRIKTKKEKLEELEKQIEEHELSFYSTIDKVDKRLNSRNIFNQSDPLGRSAPAPPPRASQSVEPPMMRNNFFDQTVNQRQPTYQPAPSQTILIPRSHLNRLYGY